MNSQEIVLLSRVESAARVILYLLKQPQDQPLAGQAALDELSSALRDLDTFRGPGYVFDAQSIVAGGW